MCLIELFVVFRSNTVWICDYNLSNVCLAFRFGNFGRSSSLGRVERSIESLGGEHVAGTEDG